MRKRISLLVFKSLQELADGLLPMSSAQYKFFNYCYDTRTLIVGILFSPCLLNHDIWHWNCLLWLLRGNHNYCHLWLCIIPSLLSSRRNYCYASKINSAVLLNTGSDWIVDLYETLLSLVFKINPKTFFGHDIFRDYNL